VPSLTPVTWKFTVGQGKCTCLE